MYTYKKYNIIQHLFTINLSLEKIQFVFNNLISVLYIFSQGLLANLHFPPPAQVANNKNI